MTFIIQSCEAFFKKPRSLHYTEYMMTNSSKKKLFLEDQISNIVLRSCNSNGAEELVVIFYAENHTFVFALTVRATEIRGVFISCKPRAPRKQGICECTDKYYCHQGIIKKPGGIFRREKMATLPWP